MRFSRGVVPLLVLAACGTVDDPAPRASDAGLEKGVLDAGVTVVDSVTHVDAGFELAPFDAGLPLVVDAGQGVPDPILFVHGINGSAADWNVMIDHLIADGWPPERMMARTFSDPKWGCNTDNAEMVLTWANELMATTHSTRIDLVVHSMGTLSSRRYLKALGGSAVVNTFVSLGGMNHGISSPCLGATSSPVAVCVWKELCQSMPYIAQLNAPPSTPGPAVWVTIAGAADTTVPNASTNLAGAENIVIPGVTHSGTTGLQQSALVYEHVVRVLRYPGH